MTSDGEAKATARPADDPRVWRRRKLIYIHRYIQRDTVTTNDVHTTVAPVGGHTSNMHPSDFHILVSSDLQIADSA
jgi:hypothetical protein